MFSEPTELLLIGCLIESIWTPKNPNQVQRTTPTTNSPTFLFNTMNNPMFSCSLLSNQRHDPPPCQKGRCRRNPIWRRSWARGCKIETCAKCGLWTSDRSPTCRVRAHLTARKISEPKLQLWIHLLQGNMPRWILIKKQRIRFSSVEHRCCPELQHWETGCEIK